MNSLSNHLFQPTHTLDENNCLRDSQILLFLKLTVVHGEVASNVLNHHRCLNQLAPRPEQHLKRSNIFTKMKNFFIVMALKISIIDRSIVTAFVTPGRFLASAVELSKHPHIAGVINRKRTKWDAELLA